MALTYRFYRSPRIGDGTSFSTAFRSKLTQYIDGQGGSAFWDVDNQAQPVRYALAFCDSTVHAAIAQDLGITALSPEIPNLFAVETWLDAPASAGLSSQSALLEGDGCSTSGAVAQTTNRDVLRYLSRLHVCIQDAFGKRRLANGDLTGNVILGLFRQALTARWNTLTVAERAAAVAWATAKGLPLAWVNNTVTARQIVHYVLTNGNIPPLAFGPVVL